MECLAKSWFAPSFSCGALDGEKKSAQKGEGRAVAIDAQGAAILHGSLLHNIRLVTTDRKQARTISEVTKDNRVQVTKS